MGRSKSIPGLFQLTNSVSKEDADGLKIPQINEILSVLSIVKGDNEYFFPEHIEKVIITPFQFFQEFNIYIHFRLHFGYPIYRTKRDIYFRYGKFKYNYKGFTNAKDVIEYVYKTMRDEIMSEVKKLYLMKV